MKIKKQLGLSILIFLGAILFAGIISTVLENSYLVFAVYIVFIIWLCFTYKHIFLKYFSYIITSLWAAFSVTYIDNKGIYIPNLRINSHYTGAVVPMIVVETIGWAALIAFDSQRVKKEEKIFSIKSQMPYNKKILYRILSIAIIAIVLFFIYDIKDSTYFTAGNVSRFVYLMSTNSIALNYYGYLTFLIPILAISAYKNKNSKPLLIFCGLLTLFQLLIGNRFSALLQIGCILLICYYIPYKEEYIYKNYAKIIRIIIALGLIFIAYAFFQMVRERGTVELAYEQMGNRLTNGQGDIWWRIYDLYKGNAKHPFDFLDEFTNYRSGGLNQLNYDYAIYRMMNIVAPNDILLAYASIGARFTSSTNASLYYYFGIVGLIVGKIILSAIMCWITNGILYSVKHNYGIDAVMYTWLLSHFSRIYSMSEFYLIISNSALLCYAVLLASYFVRTRSNSLRKNYHT